MNTLGLQDFTNRGRNVFVLTCNQPRSDLDDGHFAAKTPKHLSEFDADITAAQDDQVARQKVDIHHGTIGEKRNVLQTRYEGPDCAAAHVDENAWGSQSFVTHGDDV